MTNRFVTVPDSLELPAAVKVPIARLSDAGTAGRAVVAAETAADGRTALGLGGSSTLAVGTVAGTVKAGDWRPAAADVTDLDAQVSALAEDGGSALGASLASTYVAQGAVGGLLAPLLVGATAVIAGTTPIALDVWGGYLWGAYGTGIYRSDDEGETWALYATAAAPSLLRLLPTSDGEVVVCDSAAIRKSTGWATGSPTWTTKVTANGACQFQSWGFDGDSAGSRFIATDYSSTRADSRYVRMSLDAGDTWSIVYDSVAVHGATLADASHMHGVCRDDWGDRWYLSEGHDDGGAVGDIAGIYCSEDDGATWTRAEGMRSNPAPTVLVATADGLVCGSDSATAGLFGVERRDTPAQEQLVNTWRWRTGRAGVVGFGKRGYRQPGTGQVYVAFVTHFADVAPVIAAGTPTSGALVYTWPGAYLANDYLGSVVLPSAGRLLAYGYIDGGASRYIIKAHPSSPGARSVSTMDTGGALGGSAVSGDSMALGPRATAGEASRATAVGIGAAASTTQDGTAVGYVATAGQEATALGSGATAANYGTAVGKGATTTVEGVAVGAGAQNTSTGATAVGRNSTAGNAATAAGQLATASGEGSLALGYGASATHTRSVSLRDATTANYQVQAGARHIELKEVVATPAVAPADSVRLYARDNGSGKTQLVCIFPSGAVQVIATEP